MNVTAALSKLGIEYRLKGEEAWAHCPMHEQRTGRPDSNPSWSVNIVSGKMKCFSCGYQGNLARLVSDLTGVELSDAEYYVPPVDDPSILIERLKQAVRRDMEVDPVPDHAMYLSFDEEPPAEMLQARGLSLEVVKEYGVRWDQYNRQWVFPAMDVAGNLMGWQTKRGKRVRNHPQGLRKGKTVFGSWVVKPGETVCVVESPIDAMLSWRSGITGLSLFGSAYSDDQVDLLMSYPRVILALDNDKPGRTSQDKLATELNQAGVEVRLVVWPSHMKDFGDDVSQITSLLINARSYLYHRLETNGA